MAMVDFAGVGNKGRKCKVDIAGVDNDGVLDSELQL